MGKQRISETVFVKDVEKAKPVDVITELLRGRKVMDYAGLLAEIERELTRLRAL